MATLDLRPSRLIIIVQSNGVIRETLDVSPYCPIDMTGWSGKLQVRSTPGGTVLAEISTVQASASGGSLTPLNPACGLYLMYFANGDLAAIPAPTDEFSEPPVYDLVFTEPSGDPHPVLTGPFIVIPGVTQ